MNSVVRLDAITDPISLHHAFPSPRSMRPDTVVLGMPHLSGNGLSEGWLLRELGHRHWFMLAEAAGRPTPDFRDDKGAPVYAAFSAVSITGADFGTAHENAVLTLSSDLSRLSRTQVASRHRLTIDGRASGSVEMISTFVRRTAGGNHMVARIAVDGLPPIEREGRGSGLATLAAAFRARRVDEHMGFKLGPAAATAHCTFDPCPGLDFNGAGFLYFTSFIAFVDRAEWAFDRENASAATTIRRDVFFHGNLDPGEALQVVVFETHRLDGAFGHRCRIERCTDGAILADVFSLRALNRR